MNVLYFYVTGFAVFSVNVSTNKPHKNSTNVSLEKITFIKKSTAEVNDLVYLD